jgi:hypothetical protein
VQSLQKEIQNYVQQLPQRARQGQRAKQKNQQVVGQIKEWWDGIVQPSGQG